MRTPALLPLSIVAAALFTGCLGVLGDFAVAPSDRADASSPEAGTGATSPDGSREDGDDASDGRASGPSCLTTQLACDGACVANDGTHCGACGAACPSSAPSCAVTPAGKAACVSACPANAPTQCGGSCVDTTSDPAHCGDCARTCPAVLHADVTCSLGKCASACQAGYHACADGQCYADDDPSHCGAACTACVAPGAASVPACTNGVCGYECTGTLSDCGNGVCVDLATSAAHCGKCSVSCASSAPRTACAAGQCACASGTYCSQSNLCVDPQTDANNCGGCGHSCLGGQCKAGVCQAAVVYPSLATPAQGIASDGTNVYFSDGTGGHLWQCAAAACTKPTPILSGMTNATDVHYDAASSLVFVLDTGAGALTALANGATKWTVTGLTAPHGLATDATNVYFVDNGSPFSNLRYVSKTAGGTVSNNNINLEYPPNGGLAYWAASNWFLVVENRSTGQIISCPYQGGGASNCSNTLGADYSLGIVAVGSRFFFTAKGSSTATSGIYYGANVGSLQNQAMMVGGNYATSTSPPTADASRVYWGSDVGTVWSCPVTGCAPGAPAAVALGQGAINAMTNDGTAVYWTGSGKQVVRVAK